MRSIETKKIHVFGLFLLFSFLILILSKLSKPYSETLTLQIEKINVPTETIITDEVSTLDVDVKTFGFYLLGSYFKEKRIDLDFEEDIMLQSKTDYVLETNRLRSDIASILGSNFVILQISPDTMYFPFSILDTKKVPIQLKTDISFAPGYDSLLGFRITPDSVEVIGAEKEIQNINAVRTSELSIQNIKADINTSLSLEIPSEGQKLKLSESTVNVEAKVEKFTEGTVEVPVQITNLPSDLQINFFPKNIKLSYDVSLNDYKQIKPTDFRIECEFQNEMVGVQSFLIPKLVKSPAVVKRVKLKQSKIEYIITQ